MIKVYFVVKEELKSSGKRKYKVIRLEEKPSGKIKEIKLGTFDNEIDAKEVVFDLLDEYPVERLISSKKLKNYKKGKYYEYTIQNDEGIKFTSITIEGIFLSIVD